jgi:phage terminase large subunit GpA-like protein
MEIALLDDLDQKLAPADLYSRALIQAAQPDPIETLSEWADNHFILPSWSAEPGEWRTSRTPFLREILDCLSPRHPCREVIFMKPTQIGGTSVGEIWMGYTIHRSPASMLIVEPTLDFASKLSKQRIAPMIENSPVLRGLVREARERDSKNTILAKEFTGGMLVVTGSNSGPGLRFMAAERLFLDEIDAYNIIEKEGHPIDIVENRTDSYSRYKIYKCSTPLLAETSMIEAAYQASSQGLYNVSCPFCDHALVMKWAGLIWPKDQPEKAAYECEQCKAMIPEHKKTRMMEQGIWVHARPEIMEARGFTLNSLYTPFGWKKSWSFLAKKWVKINHKNDRAARQVFINTCFAETYAEEGEKIEPVGLMARREDYPAPVPAGVLVLTASIDTQDDRLEAKIKGWGLDYESWAIAYKIFHGSPAQHDVWNQVETWLAQTWTHESGLAMRVQLAGVDTRGHHTKAAYEFVKRCGKVRAVALAGVNGSGYPIVSRPSKKNLGKVSLFPIGTDTAKDEIFARLKITEFGPGYMHFPTLPEFDDEYFAGLASESRKPKYVNGILVGTVYTKLRSRNEPLDLEVYNLAMLTILNPNMEVIAGNMKSRAEALAGGKEAPAPIEKRRRRSGWTKGWRE